MTQLKPVCLAEAASDLAVRVDALFNAITILTSVVATVVLALITWFCIRYRRRPGVCPPRYTPKSMAWEIGWTLAPLLLFGWLFYWASEEYFYMARAPQGATEIYVVAKQWMWKLQHPDGKREINELHIPLGHPIKLIMTSQDVIHDFYVPAFRTKEDVLPGRYTTVWFTPTKPGRYHLFCSQYCGTDHSIMGGWVFVMEPADFARWQALETPSASLVARGERAYRTLGCSGCHAPNSPVPAPELNGLFGRPVPLSNRTHILADDQYLRDAILLPNKHLVAGYAATMPTYQNLVPEEDLMALVAYIKSLASTDGRGL